MAGSIERSAWIVDIDPLERGGEAVRVAFAALLSVGDDIEAGLFLVADSKKGRIVLCLLQEFRRDAPQLPRPNTRRKTPSKLLTID
jgi:hypothetical protein